MILQDRLTAIICLGLDYDGLNTVSSLKELIDEMVDIAKGNKDKELEKYELEKRN